MATILITGGSGMIGRQLTGMLLAQGHAVIIIGRKIPNGIKSQPGLSYATWNVYDQTIDVNAISKADHIIHLAGAGVADKRWNENRKKEIVDSRVQGCSLIVKALKEIPNKVQSVISASAIGWYGADTEQSKRNGFTEEAPADTTFLGETCRLWEESIEPVTQSGKRLVKLRTGIVLSKTGGALSEFRKPLLACVAAVLGSGEQVISWIHVEDLCRMYIYAIENNEMRGVYNAVAPKPVTNKQLTVTLAKHMRGIFYFTVKVPEFVLKLALGEMSVEVLKSATVSSGKIEKSGFVFEYHEIEKAIDNLA